MFRIPEQRFKRNSRQGMAILMALVILGIILVLAYIYNFTSRQGKLSSRRMFWGETTYFIVESMVEEVFYTLKSKPDLFKNKLLSVEGQEYVQLNIPLKSAKLDVAYGMGLVLDQVKILAKAIPIEADLQFGESDSVGALEVVVTAKIKSNLGKAIIRQVTARRDFRHVTLFGSKLLQDYALFMKQPSPPRSTNDFGFGDNLTVIRKPGTKSLAGKVYLGGREKNSTHILNSSNYSQADQKYLDMAGITPDGSMSFADPSIFQRSEKSRFFLDVLVNDEALERAFRRIPGRPEDSRDNALKWVEHFFYTGVGEAAVKFEIAADQDPARKVLPLRIDSPPGEALRIEGRVFREYKFSVNTEYETENDDVDHNKPDPIITHWVPQAALYEVNPFRNNTWSLFSGNSSIIEKETHRERFLPYKRSKDFSQVYPYRKGETWNIVKSNIVTPLADGTQILNIDGIVAVLAEEVIFDRKTIIRGQGVLLVMGKILILESIVAEGSNDKLVLVSRARRGNITVQTPNKVEAYLMCHSFAGAGYKGTVSTVTSEIDIHGGISTDKLNFFKLKEGSKLTYDQRYMDGQPKLILSKPMHYYKIYNNEKIEPPS